MEIWRIRPCVTLTMALDVRALLAPFAIRQMVQEAPQIVQEYYDQIVEQEVHMPHQKRIQQQMVEMVVEVAVPMTQEAIVHVPTTMQQFRRMHVHVEPIADVQVPQTLEESVHVPTIIQQERRGDRSCAHDHATDAHPATGGRDVREGARPRDAGEDRACAEDHHSEDARPADGRVVRGGAGPDDTRGDRACAHDHAAGAPEAGARGDGHGCPRAADPGGDCARA
mmetsp:Transcript_136427/g.436590  ORF Transcript_136427/g.436590 Transcript_136427/m.436590 type:complete len:225 (+) Transcript_136427:64-738(+)